MNGLISVIVPVYNVKSYLEMCVDSIISQSYPNIEIILVDDGSTDGSGELCEQLSNRDRRIKVIHKLNGGLSDARNVGIDHAAGEWICFIDSDDFVSENYIEKLVKAAAENGADIAICDPVHVFKKQDAVFCEDNQTKVFTNTEAIIEMWYQRTFLFSAWAKIYRRFLFDDVRFTKGIIYEDVDIMHELFIRSSRIVYFNAKLYAYMHRDGSITTQKFTLRELDILKICDKLNMFSCNYSKEMQKAAKAYSLVGNMRIFISAPRTEECAEYIRTTQEYIKKNGKIVLLDGKVRWKVRIGIVLFYISKKTFCYVHSKINRWK